MQCGGCELKAMSHSLADCMPPQSLLGLVFNPGKYLEQYEVFLLGCLF